MRLTLLPALLLSMLAGAAAASGANRPVDALDLDRYAGTWHEIAHVPMFFQRECVADITAQYTRRADGSIEVRNACRTREGGTQQAFGLARPVAGTPGALKVRFAPAWLSWAPFVWADYWVVDLDPEYRWAVVGGPSRRYLWVLSREPSMPRAQFEALRERAAARGYPVHKLVVVGALR